MRKWYVVIALASAQFVMVLDTTVMNVSINEVVNDLDTTVSNMQLAITLYTLVMASMMMVGGKLGDIYGRRRIFRIGSIVYAIGSGTTAIAPSFGVLLVGWSVIEGLGAAMIIPAIAALAAGNYDGRDRAVAFGVVGGIAAAGAAAGPIIGGFVATEWTWRLVFAGEVVIMVALLACSGVIKDAPRAERVPRMDLVGAVLSAAGLGLAVLGILKGTDWGWVQPTGALTVGDTEITPFGFSVVPFMILGGVLLLGAFSAWERRMVERGRDVLVRLEMLNIARLRAGLSSTLVMQFAMAGIFFVLPLFLQIVLGKDPLETGLKILPLSVGVLVVSLAAAPLASRITPKRIIQIGLAILVAGIGLLLSSVNLELNDTRLFIAMGVIGVGFGLNFSQLGNINLSSVDESESSEAGGLQGTAQNLGAALGTAVIGSILLGGLVASFHNSVQTSPTLPAPVQQQVIERTDKGIDFVPAAQVGQIATEAGLPPEQVDALVDSYEQSQIDALKAALLGVGVLSALGFLFTRRLPTERVGRDPPVASA